MTRAKSLCIIGPTGMFRRLGKFAVGWNLPENSGFTTLLEFSKWNISLWVSVSVCQVEMLSAHEDTVMAEENAGTCPNQDGGDTCVYLTSPGAGSPWSAPTSPGAGSHAQHADILTPPCSVGAGCLALSLLCITQLAPSSHTLGEGNLGSHLAWREDETLTATCTEDPWAC